MVVVGVVVCVGVWVRVWVVVGGGAAVVGIGDVGVVADAMKIALTLIALLLIQAVASAYVIHDYQVTAERATIRNGKMGPDCYASGFAAGRLPATIATPEPTGECKL